MARMTKDRDVSLGRLRDATLAALERDVGTAWKEVQGELHLQYGEMPTWILLYSAEDLPAAHARFREVVRPHYDAVRFTVAYSVFTAEGLMNLDYLEGSAEIERGYALEPLGGRPSLAKTPSIFRATNSQRP